ncbi:hypothetical protein [Massilia consociata]|uniref:Uncharacterized protein n=1 Tax=Massilia consociata TaxID=760117 RepID=A0ABV6FAH7_9BURK
MGDDKDFAAQGPSYQHMEDLNADIGRKKLEKIWQQSGNKQSGQQQGNQQSGQQDGEQDGDQQRANR